MRRAFLPLALLWGLNLPLMGELRFGRSDAALLANAGDASATVSYPFENIGPTPVSILRTEASCDCTTATLNKTTYAPGESGEISVTFRFGDREGRQSKLITVHTDAPGKSSHRLRLDVDIPAVATVLPRLLFWRGPGPYEAKQVTITSQRTGEPPKLVRADEPSGSFQIEARPLGENQGFSLSVTPLRTDQELRSELLVALETSTGQPVSYKGEETTYDPAPNTSKHPRGSR